MNLYSIDSRIDDELENDGRGRVLDGSGGPASQIWVGQ
jgi:hypothetical protein